MQYEDFVSQYEAGRIHFGVDRTKLGGVAASEVYLSLFNSNEGPRRLSRMSTFFRALIIPSLIAAVALSFIIAWWVFIPCLAIAVVFMSLTHRLQRDAVRELALVDADAFTFLRLEGIIVIFGQEKRGEHASNDKKNPV